MSQLENVQLIVCQALTVALYYMVISLGNAWAFKRGGTATAVNTTHNMCNISNIVKSLELPYTEPLK